MVFPFLSRLLALPFVLLIVYYFIHGQFQSEYLDEIILIPSMIVIVLLYVFNEQINRWWWTIRPLTLDPRIKSWVATYSPFYNSLTTAEQQRTENQISKFMLTKEYTLKSKKDYQLEEDMKALIAHELYRLTRHLGDYRFPTCKHIVVYNHPFATPDYEYLHSLEFNREDGVLILSREAIINGFNQGLDHFNVAIYGAIVIFIHENPRLDYPDIKDLTVDALCQDFAFNRESIESHIGPNKVSKIALLIYCYMEYPERLQQYDEGIYKKTEGLLSH